MLPSGGGISTGRHAHFICSIMVFMTRLEMDVSKVEQHHLWQWQFFVTQMRKSAIKCWRWLCLTVSYRCKVGTGIQKRWCVSTGTMPYGMVHVHSRRYIGGCKWRWTLDYEGMIWPYADFWFYIVLNLMVGLQSIQDCCQMVCHTI
jgi:hypothetical protein